MTAASRRSNLIRSAPWRFLGGILKIALDTRRCSKVMHPLFADTFSRSPSRIPKNDIKRGGMVADTRSRRCFFRTSEYARFDIETPDEILRKMDLLNPQISTVKNGSNRAFSCLAREPGRSG